MVRARAWVNQVSAQRVGWQHAPRTPAQRLSTRTAARQSGAGRSRRPPRPTAWSRRSGSERSRRWRQRKDKRASSVAAAAGLVSPTPTHWPRALGSTHGAHLVLELLHKGAHPRGEPGRRVVLWADTAGGATAVLATSGVCHPLRQRSVASSTHLVIVHARQRDRPALGRPGGAAATRLVAASPGFSAVGVASAAGEVLIKGGAFHGSLRRPRRLGVGPRCEVTSADKSAGSLKRLRRRLGLCLAGGSDGSGRLEAQPRSLRELAAPEASMRRQLPGKREPSRGPSRRRTHRRRAG